MGSLFSRWIDWLLALPGRLFSFGLRSIGVVIAGSGLAHFVAPTPFVAISKPIFPEDTEKWVQVNGASELAIGTALAVKQTRPIGVVGLIAYGVYLGDNVVKYVATRFRGAS